MKNIPYGKHWIDDSDIEAVVDVLRSDFLTTGLKVAEFENTLSKYVEAEYCVAVNSGTSALDIAVATLNLPIGSEVITTPFTFVADANCILYNNCKPIFADINPKTYNIDPAQIKKKITKKTKAIIYVDYAGQPCEIDEIQDIAEEHELYTIEDASHALGAEYKGEKVGTLADTTIFSFHPVKHITTGEGGAVTTNNEELYQKLKLLRNHGIDKTPSERTSYLYDMKVLGRNHRITDFQCALGISQLRKIEQFLKRREEIVKKYNDALSGIPQITLPYIGPHIRHAWHLYTLLLNKSISRDRFFDSMKKKGIGVNVHYIPCYKFTYYKQFNFDPNEYPVTEGIYSRIITLPLYPKMSNQEVEYVIEFVKDSLKEA